MAPFRIIENIRFCVVLFLYPYAALSQIAITEIQRDPYGAESVSPGGISHEFVEITNLGADTVCLDSLFVSDGVETDSIIAWPDSFLLHGDCITGADVLLPGAIALILDPDYPAAVVQTPGSRLPISPETILLTITDSDLGNGLATDDGILIYKGTKTTINRTVCLAADSSFSSNSPVSGKIELAHPGKTNEGFSVVPYTLLFGLAKYGMCSDSMTPGSFESLRNSWFVETRFGNLDTAARTFPCTLACIKSGIVPQTPVSWSITAQSGSGSHTLAQGNMAIVRNCGSASCVLGLDSASYMLQLSENGVQSSWSLDVSTLWTPACPVKISEVFPKSTAGEPEWFELVNSSSMPVNLNRWIFGNGEGFDTLITYDFVLNPGAYLVITANSALFYNRYPAKNSVVVPLRWHTLNNYNDTLCLWDAGRNLKEQICWHNSWFTEWTSQSLERAGLDLPGTQATSWALAAAPTPGQPNNHKNASSLNLVIGPLPFSPNSDGKDDLLSITPALPGGYSATVAIYGFSGKKLCDLGYYNGAAMFWDGRLENGSLAPLGPFFVVMQAVSGSETKIIRKKGVLWR